MAHRDGRRKEGGGERGPQEDSRSEANEAEDRRKAAMARISALDVMVTIRDEDIKVDPPASYLENFADALEEAKRSGAPLLDLIEVDSSYADEKNVGDDHGLFTVNATDQTVITINPKSSIFQNSMAKAKEAMKDYKEERTYSTDNVLHFMRHELSHLAHWLYSPETYRIDNFEKNEHRELVMSKVSKYSGKSPQDFVAEVRAALLNGRRSGNDEDDFPEEIKALYLHCSGGLR